MKDLGGSNLMGGQAPAVQPALRSAAAPDPLANEGDKARVIGPPRDKFKSGAGLLEKEAADAWRAQIGDAVRPPSVESAISIAEKWYEDCVLSAPPPSQLSFDTYLRQEWPKLVEALRGR